MARRAVSVVLVIVLMVFILPGCVPKTDLDECQSVVFEQADQIIELASQVTNLNATIEAKDAERTELSAQISKLKTQIVALNSTLEAENTAKIEVTFYPNPVPCHWNWTMMITEVNGVGVKLESVVRRSHTKNGSVTSRTYEGDAWFEQWINNSYLLAYGAADFRAGFPRPPVDYVVYVVYGVDDNGHKVEGSGRVDFEF